MYRVQVCRPRNTSYADGKTERKPMRHPPWELQDLRKTT